MPNVPEWAESAIDTPLITLPLSKPINNTEVLVQSSNDNEELDDVLEDSESDFEQENVDLIDSNNDAEKHSENSCPICMSDSEIGESVCVVCGYSFK